MAKHQLINFDPIKFLGLENLTRKDKEALTPKLIAKISEYLVIRTVEILPEKILRGDLTPETLLKKAQGEIPDYDKRLRSFLEDFKTEFQENLRSHG
ncbi:hypothetical protein FJZ40_05070 [Candidatus Shapirobacteria bacterium]|nr:hypothetical protein [Candidatus Shapirobacteria bacterium]